MAIPIRKIFGNALVCSKSKSPHTELNASDIIETFTCLSIDSLKTKLPLSCDQKNIGKAMRLYVDFLLYFSAMPSR